VRDTGKKGQRGATERTEVEKTRLLQLLGRLDRLDDEITALEQRTDAQVSRVFVCVPPKLALCCCGDPPCIIVDVILSVALQLRDVSGGRGSPPGFENLGAWLVQLAVPKEASQVGTS